MSNLSDSERPLVTIGIPFKNNERVLEQAILSVLHQTFQDWELLLMDDCSTDNSVSIAEKYTSDKRVKLLVDHKSLGLPDRLNKMIDLAKGHFFCRMDGDDIMHPMRIEQQVSKLTNDSSIDVIGSSAILIDEASNIVGIRKVEMTPIKRLSIVKHGLFIHPTVMGRTEWFRSNKYRKEFVLTEDLELWLRTCKTSKFEFIESPLLFYRLPAKNNLTKYRTTTLNTFKIINRHFTTSNSFIKAYLHAYFMLKYLIACCINLLYLDKLWLKKSTYGKQPHTYQSYEGSLKEAVNTD